MDKRHPLAPLRGQGRSAPALPVASGDAKGRQSASVAGVCLICLVAILALMAGACARGTAELDGWRASDPGMDLWAEADTGPEGEPVFALLYTIAPGKEYAIGRDAPAATVDGRPRLVLRARATRTLHLALVLIDATGLSFECAHTLVPGEWQTLSFDAFSPNPGDGSQVVSMKLVDRTGSLGSQGPVSLKLVGLAR